MTLFLLITLVSAQEQMQDSIFLPHSDTLNDSYRLGFNAGKARGTRISYPMNCLAGFFAGAGGSCIASLFANELLKDNNDALNWMVGASIAGGITTGGFLIYEELEDRRFPRDSVITDSLYLAGFRDGYLRASKLPKIIDTAGGCAIGTTIVTGFILLIAGIIAGIAM